MPGIEVSSITPIGVTRGTLKSLLTARREARRDMQTAIMPFTLHWATRCYRMLNLRIAAELIAGARERRTYR